MGQWQHGSRAINGYNVGVGQVESLGSGEGRRAEVTWTEAKGSVGARSSPAAKSPAQLGKRRGVLDAPAPSILDVLRDPSSAPPWGLYETLLADTSDQALRPKDPAVLFAFVQEVGHAVTVGVPKGTRKKDVAAWKHWHHFTTVIMGTEPLRRDTVKFGQRESFMVGAFIVFLTTVLKSTTPGRAFCKPESYMAHAYGIKRVHNRHGVKFNVLFLARVVFRALCDEYGRRHGPECMIPARREPFSRSMLRTMLEVPSGLRIGVRGTPALIWFGIHGSATIMQP